MASRGAKTVRDVVTKVFKADGAKAAVAYTTLNHQTANWLLFLTGMIAVFCNRVAKILCCSKARISD